MSDTALATVADALRTIASKLDTIALNPANLHVSLSIQPLRATDDETIAFVDLLGQALYGAPGVTREIGSGSHHYGARGNIGGISVTAFGSVTSPEERTMRAELERLRAELAAKP